MRISVGQLRQIIKEEVARGMRGNINEGYEFTIKGMKSSPKVEDTLTQLLQAAGVPDGAEVTASFDDGGAIVIADGEKYILNGLSSLSKNGRIVADISSQRKPSSGLTFSNGG